MRWVGRVVIMEDDELLVLAALDDFGRSSGKFGLHLADDTGQ